MDRRQINYVQGYITTAVQLAIDPLQVDMQKIVAESSASSTEGKNYIRRHHESIKISDGRITQQVDDLNEI